MWFDPTPEQQMLRQMVRDFVDRECPKLKARDLEASEEFPADLAAAIAAAGLNGIGIPEEYGGQGGDIIDQVIVCEELSRSLAGLAWLWGINVWSAAHAVLAHGTPEQRAEYLPRIADGTMRFAFALTEPGGGTDVLRAMRSTATPVEGGYLLRGNKIWSTTAHVADRIMVTVRTSPSDKPSRGLSVFLVRRDSSGLTATPIPKIGMRSLGSCEVSFDDVFVPAEDLLGEVDQGWRQITGSLNSERIMVAAMCTGILRAVLEDALEYAGQRHAFGRPIGQMQSIQHSIADMAMKLDTATLHTHRAAWLEQQGRPCGVEATMAKCLASEYAVEAADQGIQILGGYGYAQEYNMQRYWRDARLYRIGPITNEMARNYIGENLGLPRSF
ncbi:acyl-CoA dehydrogenase [Nakamurella sp. YIM 132087]|uniref:Acyl-CoA dehydrogenase n=2 Tax=Nakamurella alba TaxID=2665158 RepID=A0A7K1FH85_9ACTN|nr:acyl-CoA dehydrogenase [Nakamurella alba]